MKNVTLSYYIREKLKKNIKDIVLSGEWMK